jgi:hypothetical protein
MLLAAKENGTIEAINLAVQQCLRNIVLDRDFKVESLCTIDVDYLFLRTRGEAVGNVIKVDFICNNTPEGQTAECGGEFSFSLDLTKAAPNSELKTSFDEVELTPEYNISFRYPLFDKIKLVKAEDDEFTATVKRVMACVDYIAPKDKEANPILMDKLSIEHVTEFIEGLTSAQFDVINNFIENVPEITMDAIAKCPKCGHEHEGHFENLQSFF